MAHGDLKVLVFGASLRQGSLNATLAKLAASTAEDTGAIVDRASLRDFDAPAYDGDDEEAGQVPEGIHELRRRIEGNDAFIIASPEYNGSMCGALKNVVDWTSRFRPQPFDGKHGLLISASPSMAGGNRGLWALRVPFEHLGARIFPDMFSLAAAHRGLVDGQIADEALRARFDKTVRAFLSLAEAAKHYPCIKRAWVEFLGEPPGQGAERVEPVAGQSAAIQP
jgi:chromate reductase